jgi:glycosyltransferase involved in cell wall biosynthesis
MTIIQLTPGTGGMYCGSCLRDYALVTELRRLGHHALMLPLYLPLALEEDAPRDDAPIFFSGINVYLEQKAPWFRRAPRWVHALLASPKLLKLAANRAAKTRPDQTGDLTLSMLRGEQGNQARELDELIAWLKQHERPDVLCLSNSLLVGLARQLKAELGVPVVCSLQGEDGFLDGLPEAFRSVCWHTLAERAKDVDAFVAPSRYYAEHMAPRLRQPAERIHVVWNGIEVGDFAPAAHPPDPPVLGFFARMGPAKGLDTLVEAFLRLRQRGKVPGLRLEVGGACTAADEPFVRALQARLRQAGLAAEANFRPNLDRAAKRAFLRSLSVLSVPALCGEAFGLYVLEALACGVPVVQPRHGAFPELIEATGGGVLYEPGDLDGLVEQLERVLRDATHARALAEAGRRAVQERFSVRRMAETMLSVLGEVARRGRGPSSA